MTAPVRVAHALHVGTIVRDRRRAFGLRQRDLAEAAGVHETWIKLFERGQRSSGFAAIIRVLTALEIDCILVLRDDPLRFAKPKLKKRLPAARRRMNQAA